MTAPAEALELATKYEEAGIQAYHAGCLEEAEKQFLAALELVVAPFPAVTSINIMVHLGLVYLAVGKYFDAENIYDRAFSTSELELGPNHPGTATVLHHKASLYCHLGRYADCELVYNRARALCVVALTPESREVEARLYRGLAEMYRKCHDYAKAADSLKAALVIQERLNEHNQEPGAETLTALGQVNFLDQQYDQAQANLSKAISIYEKKGLRTIEWAAALIAQGNVFCERGCPAAAEPLLEKAVASLIEQPNKDDASFLSCEGNLVKLYVRLCKFEEAQLILERLIRVYEHHSTAAGRNQLLPALVELGEINCRQRNFVAAKTAFDRALELIATSFAPDNLQVANATATIAGNAWPIYGDEKCKNLFRQTISILESHSPPAQTELTTALLFLSVYCHNTSEYDEAEQLARRAVKILEELEVPNEPLLAVALHSLGAPLQSRGQYEMAQPFLERAVAIQRKVAKGIPAQLAHCLEALALSYLRQKKYAHAEPLYNEALKIRENIQPDSEELAACLTNYADLLRISGRQDAADKVFARAAEIRAKNICASK